MIIDPSGLLRGGFSIARELLVTEVSHISQDFMWRTTLKPTLEICTIKGDDKK